MKKILLLLMFCSAILLNAQEAAVILKTARAAGLPVELDLRLTSNGNVEIDWGSGNKVKYTVGTNSTKVQGVLSGEFIKIYGQNITFLSCANLDLTSVDVTKAKDLQQLYCDRNDLTDLDVTANTKLVRLGAHTNKLTDLDLSNNKKLTGLYLQKNQFDSRALNRMFDAIPKLKNKPSNVNFRILGNPGASTSNTDISIAKNWNMDTEGDNSGGKPIILTTNKSVGEEFLIELRLASAGNIEIDWGKGPKLANVSTETTRIKGTIEAGQDIKLFGENIVYIKCEKEKLTKVDISSAKNLQQLYVGHNELTSLDVTKNPSLARLGCNNNSITGLDLSNNKRLSGLYFQNNKLDACALNKIFNQIPSRPSMSDNVNFRVIGNPGAETSNTTEATAKNWNVDTKGNGTGCK